MDLHIISECYVDTKLIQTIAPPTYQKDIIIKKVVAAWLKLQKITKTTKSEDNDPYSNLLKQLFRSLQKNGARNINILAYWITYLKSFPYNSDMEDVKKTTESFLL
jgi:hypothetical protein